MKDSFKHVMKVLALGGLFALMGHLMSGCDGSSDLPDAGEGVDGGADVVKTDVQKIDGGTDIIKVDAGLGRSDAGMVTCAIPSPTGDAVNKSTGRTAREDALLAAESLAYLAFIVVTKDWLGNGGDARQICRDTIEAGSASDANCDSPSTDFRGAGGTRHCFAVGPSLEIDGERCMANTSGSRTCSLAPTMGVLDELLPKPRQWALCSPSGAFVGWACN
jgi:hypothetical protein